MTCDVLLPRIFRLHDRMQAAADVEVADNGRPAWVDRGDQVVEDLVGDLLVEGALVAVRPEVQLERLQLHDLLVRDIADGDRGEVGLAGYRADASELRRRDLDLVVPLRLGVGHRLKILAGLRWHAVSPPG